MIWRNACQDHAVLVYGEGSNEHSHAKFPYVKPNFIYNVDEVSTTNSTGMIMPPIEFLAEQRDAGKTIAALLRSRFQLSWNQAKRLIERGHIRVAGFACSDVSHRIKKGNRIWIREGVVEIPRGMKEALARPAVKTPPKKVQPEVKPREALPAPGAEPPPVPSSAIVYADDFIIVVDKPAGLTTLRHVEEAAEFGPKARAYLPKTLADYLPRLLGLPQARIIPVHRIDRDTSGLVVFARTRDAAEHLTRQFRKHSSERRYLALTRGTPVEGRIESILVRDRGDGRRGSVKGESPHEGKRAVTHVKLLEQFPPYSLVECRLETGRTHQVRIHLGESGAPLCGERIYDRGLHGKPFPDGSGARRPMLHAVHLGFRHPDTEEWMVWESPLPADFATLLKRFREQAAHPGSIPSA